MGPTEKALFLSLRPTYAELILSRRKTVELRRIRPRALPGTLVIIYASSPVRRIVGTCIVEDIGTATPEEIWRLHGPRTGLDCYAVAAYLHGKDRGVAITVRSATRLAEPVPLATVRWWLGDSAPPQSFRYVAYEVAEALISAGARSSHGVQPVSAHAVI